MCCCTVHTHTIWMWNPQHKTTFWLPVFVVVGGGGGAFSVRCFVCVWCANVNIPLIIICAPTLASYYLDTFFHIHVPQCKLHGAVLEFFIYKIFFLRFSWHLPMVHVSVCVCRTFRRGKAVMAKNIVMRRATLTLCLYKYHEYIVLMVVPWTFCAAVAAALLFTSKRNFSIFIFSLSRCHLMCSFCDTARFFLSWGVGIG